MNHEPVRWAEFPIRERIWLKVYDIVIACCWPLNTLLAFFLKDGFRPNSVLHISYYSPTTYALSDLLSTNGIASQYLALGTNPHWSAADYHRRSNRLPFVAAVQDVVFFWNVMRCFSAVHCHQGLGLSLSGWELKLLKKLGRVVVVHFRGCEGRDREVLMRETPVGSICETCDYNPRPCSYPANIQRRHLARQFADQVLLTTPDLLTFWPEGEAVQFQFPDDVTEREDWRLWTGERDLVVLLATNHPGIEGYQLIDDTVRRLSSAGFGIDLRVVSGASRQDVVDELRYADISISKMKMGYYANFLIESLAVGVPAITAIRQDLLSDELDTPGIINTTLEGLERTLKEIIEDPEILRGHSEAARETAKRLHDNKRLIQTLVGHYEIRA